MKIKILFVSIYIGLTGCLFCQDPLLQKVRLDLYNNFSTLKVQSEQMELQPAITAFKFNFPISELRVNIKQEKLSFGLVCSTTNFIPKIPVVFKIGNLSAGGSFSKLNNPLLSAPSSPFASVQSCATYLSASLPGYNSYSQPLSIFLQAGFSQKTSVLRDLKFSFLTVPEDGKVTYSAYISLYSANKVKIKISNTGGYYAYDENTFSSWFTKEDFYYHEGNHFCSNFQFSLEGNRFSSVLTGFIYESPFGGFIPAYRLDSIIKINSSKLSLGLFYSPQQQIITSSQKKIENTLQVISGIQNNRRYDFWMVKSAFLIYGNFSPSKTEHSMKILTGVQFTCPLTTVSLYGSFSTNLSTAYTNGNYNNFLNWDNFSIQSSFANMGFKIKNIWYLKKFSPVVEASVSLKPDNNYSVINYNHKYSLNFLFPQNITLSNSFNFSQKGKKISSWQETSGIKAVFNYKQFFYTANLSLVFKANS